MLSGATRSTPAHDLPQVPVVGRGMQQARQTRRHDTSRCQRTQFFDVSGADLLLSPSSVVALFPKECQSGFVVWLGFSEALAFANRNDLL
jgi:hypothetical protein